MNLQEFCETYGYSESTVKNKWSWVQMKILKDKGIKVVKTGRGAKVSFEELADDYPRAITMFQEELPRDLFVSTDLNMINWDFQVFLAIVTTPMLVFRGTLEQLLQYMMVPVSAESKEKVKEALFNLTKGGFIGLMEDISTTEMYFTASLIREKEIKMKINYQMLITCQRLAEEENKRSWIPLLKTWLGVQMLSDKESYEIVDLQNLTGLSAYQIRESNKILNKNDIYRSSRAFLKFNKCLGSKAELNVFYNEDVALLPDDFRTQREKKCGGIG